MTIFLNNAIIAVSLPMRYVSVSGLDWSKDRLKLPKNGKSNYSKRPQYRKHISNGKIEMRYYDQPRPTCEINVRPTSSCERIARPTCERPHDLCDVSCKQHPKKKKTTAPRIPAWSPTVVLTGRHFG